jgi:DNA polymerase-1
MANAPSQFPAAQRLVLVDGHAFAYRSFHGIRSLNAPDGFPTNAIFGFIKTVGKLSAILQPEYLMVLWDGGLARERVEALPEYKAQRPPMPEGLALQLDGIQDYLAAAGYLNWQQEGVEADDAIAAMTTQGLAQGANVIIASPDKDFQQLVGAQVGLWNPHDASGKIWTAADVRERTGVEPGQIVDWLSLIGDSVDNIAGVEGVGPKTATSLLQQFGTIHAMYGRLNEIPSERLREALRLAEGVVKRNQAVIRLNDGVSRDFVLAQARMRPAETTRLRELFARWGFHTLLREVGGAAGRQGELF